MASHSEMIRPVVKVADRAKFGWSLANGFAKNASYPYHSYGAGIRGGFVALLRLYEQDLDYICRGPVQGFKVLLHLPNELPNIGSHYIRVPLSTETFVSIQPKVTTTADSVKYLQPNVRGCYYNGERQLKYFNEYTQRNCESECVANITLNKCGCVKFSMPR